jgi:hypothetical protein
MGYNPDRLFFDGWTTTLRLARAELGTAADGANVVAPEEFTEASQFDRFRARFSTRFSPTSSGRQGDLVLPTMGRRQSMTAVGDGDFSSSSLDDGVRGLWCTIGDGESTNGGDVLRRTFLDGWLSAGGSTPARQRAKMTARV